MATFQEFTGKIIGINDMAVGPDQETGCYQIMSLDVGYGSIVNFIIGPNTYFLNNIQVQVGDRVTFFIPANDPAPLIYPPSYYAKVASLNKDDQIVKVDYFNQQLISSDQMLQINIGSDTKIISQNGQRFNGSLANRNLVVVYRQATKSLPAITTPIEIVVLCT